MKGDFKMLVGRGGVDICCKHCLKDICEPTTIIRYKDDYFCDETCLGEYLVSKIEDEIEVVEVDTEENIKMCAEESKNEW